MKKLLFILLCVCSPAFAADNGLITKPSKYSFAETVSKIETVIKAKGLVLFAKIDHSGEAEKVGIKMRPTQLLIFGNPKGGIVLGNQRFERQVNRCGGGCQHDGRATLWATKNK